MLLDAGGKASAPFLTGPFTRQIGLCDAWLLRTEVYSTRIFLDYCLSKPLQWFLFTRIRKWHIVKRDYFNRYFSINILPYSDLELHRFILSRRYCAPRSVHRLRIACRLPFKHVTAVVRFLFSYGDGTLSNEINLTVSFLPMLVFNSINLFRLHQAF